MGRIDAASLVRQVAPRLGLRWLFGLLLGLFLLDLLIPDFIPFVDEIVLGLLTALVGMLQARFAGRDPAAAAPERPLRSADGRPVIDVDGGTVTPRSVPDGEAATPLRRDDRQGRATTRP
jgi:hypothetical protein